MVSEVDEGAYGEVRSSHDDERHRHARLLQLELHRAAATTEIASCSTGDYRCSMVMSRRAKS